MSVGDRLGGLSTDGFAKLTDSQPIHHARSTHLDHTTPMPGSYAISLFEFPDPSASRAWRSPGLNSGKSKRGFS
jgi:hypothetical protein